MSNRKCGAEHKRRAWGGVCRYGVAFLLFFAAACESIPDIPDAVNPISWFEDDEKPKPAGGADSAGAYPSLKTVPDRPKVPSLSQQQARMTQGLAGDSKNARYTDAQIQKEVLKRSTPPVVRQRETARRFAPPAPARVVAAPPQSRLVAVPAPAPNTRRPVAAPSFAPRKIPEPVRRTARVAVPPPPPISKSVPARKPTVAYRPAAPTPRNPVPPTRLATNVAPAKIGSIYFSDGSTTVQQTDHSVLRQIANAQRLTGGLLEVVGHASGRVNTFDPNRRNAINFEVSIRRAKSVAAALVGLGVPASQLRVDGAGDSRQIYSEFTPAGEAANRRVEVFLIR
jgi:outer membrane protein OmpA-like peptidoglycan-associated protein